MAHAISVRRIASGLVLIAALSAGSVRADAVLLGSDYFETVQPTFFIVPPGYPLAATKLPVQGVPIGPGTTDTIVQRQANCSLNLAAIGSNCTIPIELVTLSLMTVDQVPSPPLPLFFRESPVTASTGQMIITSDGTGTGGTFSSFFDVFIDFSPNGGTTWIPFDWDTSTPNIIDPLHLVQSNAVWSTAESGLLVDGLVGDQSANRHTNNSSSSCPSSGAESRCVDFYLLDGGVVTEEDTLSATHTVRAAVPEPGSLALVGLAMAVLGGLRRRAARVASLLATMVAPGSAAR